MAEDKKALAARLVTAYLRKNAVAVSDISELIRQTYSAIDGIDQPVPEVVERQQPAVALKKSITADHIICLDCGKPQKMLKRHLNTAHGLSPDEYRSKWGLGDDYPLVAPNYAQHRSELAIKIGLGRKQPEAAAPEAAPTAPAQAQPAAPAPDDGDDSEPVDGRPQHRYPASRWAKPTD